MFCKKCGKELPEGAKFCNECGTPVTTDGLQEQERKDQAVQEPTVESSPQEATQGGNNKLKKILVSVIIIAVAVIVIIAVAMRVRSNNGSGEFTGNAGEIILDEETTNNNRTAFFNNSSRKNSKSVMSNTWQDIMMIPSANIITLTFMDDLSEAPDDAFDISENNDGSVLAWTVAQRDPTLQDVYIAGKGGVIAPENSSYLFYKFRNMEEINANDLDVTNVTDMSNMFNGCLELKSLDVSSWNTSNVTSMNSIFSDCYKLAEINGIDSWDTSNVEDMGAMFSRCHKLTSIDASGWDTSNVVNMSEMFKMCEKLTSVGDISNWDVSHVIDMSGMFWDCASLPRPDISNWNMYNVQSSLNMFAGIETNK